MPHLLLTMWDTIKSSNIGICLLYTSRYSESADL